MLDEDDDDNDDDDDDNDDDDDEALSDIWYDDYQSQVVNNVDIITVITIIYVSSLLIQQLQDPIT
jgi:hypothetical protein